MAGSKSQPPPYLTTNQQNLLRAALASNNPSQQVNSIKDSKNSASHPPGNLLYKPHTSASDDMDRSLFASPQQIQYSAIIDPSDFVDDDTGFDVDGDLAGKDMIGGPLPELDGTTNNIKRKNSDDDDDDDVDHKRREGEEKVTKKPGRKPLTSEPTTKRKAQNRAAQRAFRERKEQHLKDLEIKISELTKSAEVDKQENGVLKAQVARLQSEVEEYKKRLSSDNNRGPSASLITMKNASSTHNNNGALRNNFAFDFPAFGGIVSPQMFGSSTSRLASNSTQNNASPSVLDSMFPTMPLDTSSGKSQSSRTNLNGSSLSPVSSQPSTNSPVEHSRTGTNKPQQNFRGSVSQTLAADPFGASFIPGMLNGAGFGSENNDYGFPKATGSPSNTLQNNSARDSGTDSNSGLSRVFRLNSGSTSTTADSPSQSSLSQFYPNSSCGTSPEPSHPSPPKDATQISNSANQTSQKPSYHNDLANFNTFGESSNLNGIDWLASQNGGQFDPVLFGDYRESQDAIVGDGDFNNGFFNDALPYDFGSPFHLNTVSSPRPQQQANTNSAPASRITASQMFLAEVEKNREGGDENYGLPGFVNPAAVQPTQTKQLLNCNIIWNQLQDNKDFQDGKFDLDALCGELRAKARCSESGVVVPADTVHLAFQKLSGHQVDKYPNLCFEKSHVDDALRRLGGTRAQGSSDVGQ